jgi:fatty-acyl-CoA synthase
VLIVDEGRRPIIEPQLPRLSSLKATLSAEDEAHWVDGPLEATQHISAREDDVALIMYTSGTTGRPKGVIVTWATLLGQYMNVASVDSISSASNFLSSLPLFHAGSLNVLANPILLSGGCVSIARRFDAGQVLSAIAATKERPVTHYSGIPLIYQEIVSHPAFGATDLSGLRHAQMAGGGTSRPVLEALRAKGVVLQPHYGASETGPAVTAMSIEEARQEYPANAIGRAVLHSMVRVVDEGGADVPDGTDGEIWVKGPSVTPGYWKLDPALAFTDGWYRTGDGAYRDADGRYFYRDRLKAMYKSGGENV